ncbi:MAG TPA: hypothetical protein VIH47_04345 [Solirubrobacterales bacterium]
MVKAPISHLRSALALIAVSLLGGCVIWVPVAEAEAPSAPLLSHTNPKSPGFSTTPRIIGREGGVGTSVIGLRTSAMKASLDPTPTVTLYTDSACVKVAGSGPLSEFEGLGIQVAVAPGSTTSFYATLTDPSEAETTSTCSRPIVYRQVSEAPAAPIVEGVTPSSPADDNLPFVLGQAEGEATVDIYGDPACTGVVLGSGSGESFSAEGVQAVVPDNSTTTLYATASWAGFHSSCSSTSVSYREVTLPSEPEGGGGGGEASPPATAPERPPVMTPDPPGRPPAPKLRTTPEGTSNQETPLVTGKAPNATIVKIFGEDGCKGPVLAQGSASEFEAGLPVHVVENTSVSFYGVSIDGGGDQSPCTPDPTVYVEDSTAPVTRITAGPALKTHKPTVVFRFADAVEDLSTSFLCKLDHGVWRPCQAPLRLSRLGYHRHVLRVKAVDAAGNFEKRAAKRSFQVLR